MFADVDQCQKIMADQRLAAVKFTGSTLGGAAVGRFAGKHLKKVCLELGGNDPFCVLPDADLAAAVDAAYNSRMMANA